MVRSFSFPGSTPVCPKCVRIAWRHSRGFIQVSPQCPACGVGHLGVTWGAWRHNERASVIVQIALVRGSPECAPQGRHRHPGKLIERTLRESSLGTFIQWYHCIQWNHWIWLAGTCMYLCTFVQWYHCNHHWIWVAGTCMYLCTFIQWYHCIQWNHWIWVAGTCMYLCTCIQWYHCIQWNHWIWVAGIPVCILADKDRGPKDRSPLNPLVSWGCGRLDSSPNPVPSPGNNCFVMLCIPKPRDHILTASARCIVYATCCFIVSGAKCLGTYHTRMGLESSLGLWVVADTWCGGGADT